MPSFIIRIALLSSALAPMMLIWSIISFFDAKKTFNKPTIIVVVIFLIFLVIPPLVLRVCKKGLADEAVRYTSLTVTENGGEGFIGTYILPYLSNVVTDEWYLLMVGVMAFLTIIMWSNNSYCYNPVLSLFGYRFYTVENTKNVGFILLSKRIIKDPIQVESVYNITDFLVLDKGGD